MSKFRGEEFSEFMVLFARVSRLAFGKHGGQAGKGRRAGCSLEFFSDQIPVFVSEANDGVLDIFGRMFDEKHGGGQVKIGNGELAMLFMFMSQLGNEVRLIR